MDVQALFAIAMPLASLLGGDMQVALVAILAALCGGGIATGIMLRRLTPVLKKVESVAEREEARIRRTPTGDAADRRSSERDHGRSDQALRHAYEVMRDLHDLTQSLDEQSQALHSLAHRLLKESTPGVLSRAVMEDAAESAEGLSRIADQAHRTYKRLSSSLGQLFPLSDQRALPPARTTRPEDGHHSPRPTPAPNEGTRWPADVRERGGARELDERGRDPRPRVDPRSPDVRPRATPDRPAPRDRDRRQEERDPPPYNVREGRRDEPRVSHLRDEPRVSHPRDEPRISHPRDEPRIPHPRDEPRPRWEDDRYESRDDGRRRPFTEDDLN